jgi:hypothetical protein
MTAPAAVPSPEARAFPAVSADLLESAALTAIGSVAGVCSAAWTAEAPDLSVLADRAGVDDARDGWLKPGSIWKGDPVALARSVDPEAVLVGRAGDEAWFAARAPDDQLAAWRITHWVIGGSDVWWRSGGAVIRPCEGS